ncbi:MAG: MotA/TolQ/ExbB proton channel family protein [Gammaproteobacteria bacterium]|nr:MotA/TolQ/ExbB proton channel family protein [Gammaproteobacteria bacterium]
MGLFDGSIFGVMHILVSFLLQPVIWALLLLTGIAIIELGICVAERTFALKRWSETENIIGFEELAMRRIERTDFLTRIAPMLGLMGTLIPLGPGLSALGDGNLSVLTTAMSVAFDTTVLGLLVGIIGFVIGRFRRRWYESTMRSIEVNEGKN